MHRGWLACLSAALLLGAAVSIAGPEKVAFPAGYTEGRLYAKVDDKGARLRGPDGQRQNVDTKPCFECHKPESANDYVFTLNELRFKGH